MIDLESEDEDGNPEEVPVGTEVEDIEAERMASDERLIDELEMECEDEDEDEDEEDEDEGVSSGQKRAKSKLRPLTMEERRAGCLVLNKVSKPFDPFNIFQLKDCSTKAITISKKVSNNGLNRDAFKAKCQAATDCEILELIKVIVTRWNSYGKCLLRLCRVQPAVVQLCADKTLPFRKYALTGEEWDIIDELEEILAVSNPLCEFYYD